MESIYIFTENYRDVVVKKLPDAVPHNFDGLDCLVAKDDNHAAIGLSEAAAQIIGTDASESLEDKFKDFLLENKYIHFDAFIRICLEDIDD